MSKQAEIEGQEFERFRSYLRFLARVQLDQRLKSKIDPSDIVQQSLMKAYVARGQFRGTTEGERAAWLRGILIHELAHTLRKFHREKRDISREQTVQEAVEASSARLEMWLAADHPSPSQDAVRVERMLLVATAIDRLPFDQQEAVILRYWQGLKLSEIAEQLKRTTGSVAGLIQRGLKALRNELRSLGIDDDEHSHVQSPGTAGTCSG